MDYLLVFIGAGFGGVMRFITGKLAVGAAYFMTATFIVNLVGSFLIGVAAYVIKIKLGGAMSLQYWYLLVVGVLGGFTTFSSFSLDNLMLIQDGKYLFSIAYIGLTVVLGVSLCFTGYKLASLL